MSSHLISAEAKTYNIGNSPLAVQSYIAQQSDKDQPAIFVIPAAKQNAIPFRYIGMELAQRGMQVHVLSLRGHSPSKGRCSFATFAHYIEDIRSTLRKLDLSSVIILGHSLMGGCLAQEFARIEQCAGLILMNACLPQDALRCMQAMIKELSCSHPLRLALSTVYPQILFNRPDLIRRHLLGEEAPDALVEEMLKEGLCDESLLYFSEVVRLNFKLRKPDLRPLKTSHILSIVGEYDYYFPPTASAGIVDFYQNLGAQTTQRIVSGAPHNSQQTHPEIIAQLVDEFWKEIKHDHISNIS